MTVASSCPGSYCVTGGGSNDLVTDALSLALGRTGSPLWASPAVWCGVAAGDVLDSVQVLLLLMKRNHVGGDGEVLLLLLPGSGSPAATGSLWPSPGTVPATHLELFLTVAPDSSPGTSRRTTGPA